MTTHANCNGAPACGKMKSLPFGEVPKCPGPAKVAAMLDRDGFRPNVGIVLLNRQSGVFWGKRIGTHSWQFPQGGIDRGETPEGAMYRELGEEVGLRPHHVQICGRTRDWLRYETPAHYVRKDSAGRYRGQKQIWFLLQFLGHDSDINLRESPRPEFDAWRWSDYWVELDPVVEFKRGVYVQALTELERFLPAMRSSRLRYPRARIACDANVQWELPPDASVEDTLGNRI